MAEDYKEVLVGEIIHYYGHIGVGIVKLEGALRVGDKIHIKGHSDDFEQVVESMQVEHKPVDSAKKGEVVGVKVVQKVHEGDKVYLVK